MLKSKDLEISHSLKSNTLQALRDLDVANKISINEIDYVVEQKVNALFKQKK